MTLDIPTIIAVSFQIITLAVLLVFSVGLIRRSGRSLTAVFLTFVYTLLLLTDLYWVIYDFMRPGIRMPFAVNEVGEAAGFLLMSALLSSAVNYRLASARKQAIGTVLFAVCNVALWIAWSGEWAQDLIVGAAFSYFLISTTCALKVQRQLSKSEWIGLGIGCTLLILAQSLTFFTKPQTKNALETGCYIFLVAGIVYWTYKMFAARKKQASSKAVLCLVFALISWLITAVYMSDGMWYSVFLAVETFAQLLMYLSVRKVVAEE